MVEFRGEKLKYLITLVVFFPVHVQETQIIFTVFSWHLCAGLGNPSEYVQSSAIAGNCNVYSQPLISQDTYDKVKFRPFFWGDSKRWDCTFGALLGLALVLIAAFSQLIILFYWCEFSLQVFPSAWGFFIWLSTSSQDWEENVAFISSSTPFHTCCYLSLQVTLGLSRESCARAKSSQVWLQLLE